MSMLMRRREMIIEDSWLPEGCVELEYLESDGGQHIDTGIIPIESTYIFIELEFISFKKAFSGIIGAETIFKVCRVSTAESIRFEYNSFLLPTTNGVPISKNIKYTIIIKDGIYEILDYYGILPNTKFSGTGSIFIFAAKAANSSIENGSSLKVYKCHVDEKIFLPILDSTGRPCMYDTIGKQYYYNQGTGEFLYKIKE